MLHLRKKETKIEMPSRLEYEYVKKTVELEGYKLITKKYKNAHQKLEYICPKGHKHSMTWNNWKSKKRCPTCANKYRGKNWRIKFGFIKAEFKKEGYKLLTKKYKNNRQKLRYICDKGHKHSIKWNHWKSGHRCPYCDGQNKPQFNVVKASFEKEGYQLLTTKYKNSKQKLEYICPRGHKHSVTWEHWKIRKQRCPICYRLKMKASGHWNWKGGITPKNVLLRFSNQYTQWRKSIFERDNYICQICNKRGSSLHAHHIFRFSIFKLRRYKIWNGITLCEKCHKAIKGKENKFVAKFLFLNLKKCKNGKCYKL